MTRRSLAFAVAALAAFVALATPARAAPLAVGRGARETSARETRATRASDVLPRSSPSSAASRDAASATTTTTATTTTARESERVPALAPELVVDGGELTLCGGAPLPESLPLGRATCVEQKLVGLTAADARARALEAVGVNVTFDGVAIDKTLVSDPALVLTPSATMAANARGLFDWLSGGGCGGANADDAAAAAAAAAEALAAETETTTPVVRFNVTLTGIPPGTSGEIVARVAVMSVPPEEGDPRWYYEIVWYELSATVPTFYAGAEYVTIREGLALDLTEAEIEQNIDDLTQGEAIFFPCTNFIGAVFCEENGVSF